MNRFMCTSVLTKLLNPINFNNNYKYIINSNIFMKRLITNKIDTNLSQNSSERSESAREETKPLDTIIISDNCVQRLKRATDYQNQYLRVEVESGGCSGLQYKFEISDQINADDRVFEKDGIKVVIDETSLQYIKGSTLDYSEELIRSAFRVVNNPQSEKGCSCGSSFASKLVDNKFKF